MHEFNWTECTTSEGARGIDHLIVDANDVGFEADILLVIERRDE